MATAEKKDRRRQGIILLVLGVIIIIFFGFTMYAYATQGGVLAYGGILPTFVGVVLFIIGLGLLLDYYYKAREEKPSKPSRWKQAKPIT